MKKIQFTNAHRQSHFEFFNNLNHPHFCLTANVDIKHFYSLLKSEGIPFTPAIVYVLSRACNEIPEIRQRIRGNEIVEHALVHPSFSVHTEEADVFSFCYVDYVAKSAQFIANAQQKIEQMLSAPEMEDEPGRDDYLFMSAIPWVHFTSLQHAMQLHPTDSVPRISWGKFLKNEKDWPMPLSIQVHHALVDGRHVGQFYQHVEHLLNSRDWI